MFSFVAVRAELGGEVALEPSWAWKATRATAEPMAGAAVDDGVAVFEQH